MDRHTNYSINSLSTLEWQLLKAKITTLELAISRIHDFNPSKKKTNGRNKAQWGSKKNMHSNWQDNNHIDQNLKMKRVNSFKRSH